MCQDERKQKRHGTEQLIIVADWNPKIKVIRQTGVNKRNCFLNSHKMGPLE
jgi:hypothetical protein